MLASALRRLDNSTNPDDRVYAIETQAGVRKYTVMCPGAAWKRTESAKPAHLYEVLSGPCNLYLDIEWKCDSAPADEHAIVEDVVRRTCTALARRYSVESPTVTSASASGVHGTSYKCSWHVHIQCANVCWLNTVAVGQFVRSACADMDVVDKVPYAGTGQNWRCVGSAKYAEPSRKFRPVDQSTFMRCTVQQPVNGRSIIYPDVSIPAAVAVPVPENILELANTLNAGGDPTMSSPTRCIVPFRARQLCEHAGRYHRSNHQYAVINTSTLMWKMRCHACADAIGTWRPFDDTVALESAFAKQTSGYHADVPEPAVRIDAHDVGDDCILDLRTVGPPAPLARDKVYLCRDGMYAWD